jgi:uncharacterized membrane protein HdeD (DUF308 family)
MTEPAPLEERPRNGRGVAALVLGVVALVFTLLLSPPLGLVLGIAALVVAVLGRRAAARGEATNRAQATAGLVTGIISVVVGGLFTVLFVVFYFSEEGRNLRECLGDADTDAEEQACRDEFENR